LEEYVDKGLCTAVDSIAHKPELDHACLYCLIVPIQCNVLLLEDKKSELDYSRIAWLCRSDAV
jgi:hypothetical protein